MPTSEARIAANQRNAQRSTGPSSTIGKRIASMNSLKHGLSGAGTVLAADDAAEVERLNIAFTADMAPKSEMGAALIFELASLTVRRKCASRQEFAANAERVRNAPENFDQERVAIAEALFESLHQSPRANLRKLKRTLEGVIQLVEAWEELKADLTRPSKPRWTAAHMVTMGNLLGIREEDVRGSQIGVLSDAIWGGFERLGDHEGGGLDDEARKAWARAQVVELIDETCTTWRRMPRPSTTRRSPWIAPSRASVPSSTCRSRRCWRVDTSRSCRAGSTRPWRSSRRPRFEPPRSPR